LYYALVEDDIIRFVAIMFVVRSGLWCRY